MKWMTEKFCTSLATTYHAADGEADGEAFWWHIHDDDTRRCPSVIMTSTRESTLFFVDSRRVIAWFVSPSRLLSCLHTVFVHTYNFQNQRRKSNESFVNNFCDTWLRLCVVFLFVFSSHFICISCLNYLLFLFPSSLPSSSFFLLLLELQMMSVMTYNREQQHLHASLH